MSVVSPNQAGVYAVSAILMFASAGAVALRFLARRIKQVGWKSDDWLALISMVRSGLSIVWEEIGVSLTYPM